MLAKQSPWTVVYPTLVDKTACEGECSEEIQHLLDCLVLDLFFHVSIHHFQLYFCFFIVDIWWCV